MAETQQQLRQVAAILGMGERRVRVWLDRGTLAYVQPTGCSDARLVTPAAVAELTAFCGLGLHWEAVALT